MLELLNNPNAYLAYGTSELEAFLLNNINLCPGGKLVQPQPILSMERLEECLMQKIIDF